MMNQLSKEQAIAFAESGIWKDWTHDEIVRFQLYQEKLCMDFSRFHEAVENVLKRPVFSHEFAYIKKLQDEFEGKCGKPSFEEIINLIPADKRVIIAIG